VIEYVEKLRPKFQIQPFSDWVSFNYRNVPLLIFLVPRQGEHDARSPCRLDRQANEHDKPFGPANHTEGVLGQFWYIFEQNRYLKPLRENKLS
jgi:hypothetical protein